MATRSGKQRCIAPSITCGPRSRRRWLRAIQNSSGGSCSTGTRSTAAGTRTGRLGSWDWRRRSAPARLAAPGAGPRIYDSTGSRSHRSRIRTRRGSVFSSRTSTLSRFSASSTGGSATTSASGSSRSCGPCSPSPLRYPLTSPASRRCATGHRSDDNAGAPFAVTALHGPIDALLMELHTRRGGLTADEARRRLGEVGPNEPARAPRTAGLVQILLLLANPLVIILLIASAASAILGERVNASIIVLMVALSMLLNFVQTYRSHRVAERLRDAVAPTATALRDGTWIEIRRRELVPGDIVRLAAGDRVPADARLLEARDLHVQQAALTGESLPVEKQADGVAAAARDITARDMVFLGTSVVSGTATAVVVATGHATAFGDIAAQLAA